MDKLVRELSTHCTHHRLIEIGPGGGALTVRLINAGFEVTAIEIDRELAVKLMELPGPLTVINDSILNHDPGDLGEVPAIIIGSLPYHISGAILRWTADHADVITLAIYVLQDEVVGRIGAPPGDTRRGLLSVVMQSVFSVTPLFRIAPGSFHPRPKVWSRAVKMTRTSSSKSVLEARPLWKVASAMFEQRRKMIGGRLIKVYGKEIADRIRARGVDLTRRPETLTLAELELITHVIQEVK